MPKVRNLIVLLLVIGALWHFYGETFSDSGFRGVYDEMRSDADAIKENPKVTGTIEYINREFQFLFGKLKETVEDDNQSIEPSQSVPDKPELDSPSEHSFSVHNVEIGDDRSDVEEQAGTPQRTSMNEYGLDWVTYHKNYHNFFMVAYDDQDKVTGLYTTQDLLTSKDGINFDSSRETVLTTLNYEPLKYVQKGFTNYQIQNNQEYDMFQIDNNYVTIFYDKHEDDKVTAIQILSEDMEQLKDKYFGEPSDELKEGLEYQLFDLTNAARVSHGLPVLSWDDAVRVTARDHSNDMAVNNYFSHTNLDGQSPFDRMSEDNISYRMAGENLAAGQSSSIFAHEGLMNSIGHRENILQEDFEALAVGVAFNEEGQPYYTENFLTK